jgi:hypothetical protein
VEASLLSCSKVVYLMPVVHTTRLSKLILRVKIHLHKKLNVELFLTFLIS